MNRRYRNTNTFPFHKLPGLLSSSSKITSTDNRVKARGFTVKNKTYCAILQDDPVIPLPPSTILYFLRQESRSAAIGNRRMFCATVMSSVAILIFVSEVVRPFCSCDPEYRACYWSEEIIEMMNEMWLSFYKRLMWCANATPRLVVMLLEYREGDW